MTPNTNLCTTGAEVVSEHESPAKQMITTLFMTAIQQQ